MAATLLGMWERLVRRAPRAPALRETAGGRTWTRAELAAAAAAAAQGLGPAGDACRGGYVALAEPNGAGWLAAFLALRSRGAVPLLLDPGSGSPGSSRSRPARPRRAGSGRGGSGAPDGCSRPGWPARPAAGAPAWPR
ncbi:MAG TPA: AMP-binding protein [Opitutaceae bacterium]|nr:AMP-binding protein [Opitutaceae bacterium]